MSSRPPTLNLVGAGRVGRTLAALWLRAGVFTLGDVLTRSAESAAQAVAALGAGRPVTQPGDARSAGVADRHARRRPGRGRRRAGRHGRRPGPGLALQRLCPGGTLAPLQQAGWSVASAHPA
jgi:hypothetical protein